MFRLFISILFLGLAPSIEAATVQHFDLEALTIRAERVFIGRCQRVSVEVEDSRISTRYLFTVEDVLKGKKEAQVELILPGGHFQDVVSHISGMPTFSPGEEVVLFLSEENQLGSAWPIGLGQGKFRIDRTAAKPARIFQELDGLSFYPVGAAKNSTSREVLQGMELDGFLARVRQLIDTTTTTTTKGADDAR